jgi:hypothetical protein
MSPDDLDHFIAGLQGYQRAMDGLNTVFTRDADKLRDLANEMTPLIGSADPQDQAELAVLTAHVNLVTESLRRWTTETPKSYEKAFKRFLKMYVNKWENPADSRKMTKGVEGMRSVFRAFFARDAVSLIEAGTKLGSEDLAGFWDTLAVAEGAEAFTVHAFEKPYRSLLSLT